MRVLYLGLALFLMVSEVRAQEKKQPPTQILEIAGHSLEYWISQIASKDSSKSENAIRTVLSFGPDRAYQAVPAILDRLRKHTAQNPVDFSVRVNGVIALGVILGTYREADLKVVKDAVTILRRYLSDTQSIMRYRAAQALGRIGTEARDTIPELIIVAKDPSTWEARQAGAVALAQIAHDRVNLPSGAAVLGTLTKLLGDTSSQVRLAAVQALSGLGVAGNPTTRLMVIKALEPVAYKDGEPGVSIWAQMGIISLSGVVDKERVDAIAHTLSNSDPTIRQQAIQALGLLGKEAKATIPLLVKTLHDRDAVIAAWSMWALCQMGPSAAAALPDLQQMNADVSQPESLRRLAEEAIEKISGKKK